MRRVARLVAPAVVVAMVFGPSLSLAETKRFKAAGSAGDWSWEPKTRRIDKGDRIRWKNPTNVAHTVTAYKGPWNKDTRVESGESTSKRFKKVGVYKFRCLIGAGTPAAHSTLEDGVCSGMCGTVHVH